jgi:hypothetical protein
LASASSVLTLLMAAVEPIAFAGLGRFNKRD